MHIIIKKTTIKAIKQYFCDFCQIISFLRASFSDSHQPFVSPWLSIAFDRSMPIIMAITTLPACIKWKTRIIMNGNSNVYRVSSMHFIRSDDHAFPVLAAVSSRHIIAKIISLNNSRGGDSNIPCACSHDHADQNGRISRLYWRTQKACNMYKYMHGNIQFWSCKIATWSTPESAFDSWLLLLGYLGSIDCIYWSQW